jgi:CheY-like chemotaxis protein
MEGHTGIPRRVLVLCQEVEASRVIEEATRPWLFETVACSSGRESLRLLEQEDFALIFCAEQYVDGTYRDILASAPPHKAPVVIMISDPNPDAVFREAMSLGALGVVSIPCSKADVQWMVIRAMQKGPAVRAS